jgi:hypothetical protein
MQESQVSLWLKGAAEIWHRGGAPTHFFRRFAMKRAFVLGSVVCVLAGATAPALAVDFEYFKKQPCGELAKELDALQKAEKVLTEKKDKADSKANTQAVVTTLLIGWPFWGDTDHGDTNAQLAEIRTDVRYITKAQKVNKCS